ncbi:response regulator, partial [Leptolyngbya cf. ectocarpi LEGE 11479]
EYLKNMGVASTLTMPLLDEQGLWGLIACHHGRPTDISVETRDSLSLLSKVASLNLFRQKQLENSYYRNKSRQFLTTLRAAKKQNEASLQQVFVQNSNLLLEIFKADGLALIFDQDITLTGNTPSEADIPDLIHWLRKRPSPIFSTCALSKDYRGALPAGLLSVTSGRSQSVSYGILLFRPEQLRTVSWAGRFSDTTKINPTGDLELCPRKSFELWKEELKGQALPWSSHELTTALDLHSILIMAALDHSEAVLRAKSEFLANMSHEIRTPMNAMIGMTELLNETSLDAYQKKIVSVIRTGSDTLLTVINDILDFSKIESKKLILELDRLDLYQCVEDVVALFTNQATEKGLTLKSRVELAHHPKFFKGDAVRLRQILANLISNSIKFTERGEIDIYAEVHPTDSSLNTKESARQYSIEFRVEDTGIGIAPDKIQHLFQPFSQADASITRKYGGTGLGLAINKQLIEMMGGTIWVESAVNQGTIFDFSIRLEADELLGSNSPHKQKNLSFSDCLDQPPARYSTKLETVSSVPLRILLAEDIALNQVVALQMLKSCGYDADIVNNGKEVIDALQHQSYDLVLMDIQMPEMDGLVATQTIRLSLNIVQPYIVAMTANAMQGVRETYLAAGMDDYISKPIHKRDLKAAIQKCQSLRPAAVAAEPAVLSSAENLDALPTLDSQVLEGMGGNHLFLKEICDTFLEDAPRRIYAIQSAIEQKDPLALSQTVHALKSLSRGIGAMNLAQICQTMESLVSSQSIEPTVSMLSQITHEYKNVTAAVQRYKTSL